MNPDPDRTRLSLDLDRILIPRDRIAQRVRELAHEIERTYLNRGDDALTFVTILSGSLIFLADLIRELPLRMKIGLITVSSYRGPTTQPAGSKLLSDLNVDVAGRDVLLIDDILDTGGTLRTVRARVAGAGAKSIRICVLLRKPSKAPATAAKAKPAEASAAEEPAAEAKKPRAKKAETSE